MTTTQQPDRSAVAPEDRPQIDLPQSRVWFGFGILYVLFLLDFATRLGVNAVLPLMQKELGFSDARMGMIGSAVLVGMTCFVLPFSFLADRGSKKVAVLFMSAVWGLGTLCTGMVSSFALLLGGRFLVGMGNSAFAPVSVSILTSWFRQARWGTVIGAYNSSMSLGLALGTALTGLLAAHWGWRTPFLVLGGLTLFFMALASFLPKTSGPHKKSSVTLGEACRATLGNRTLLLVSLGAGLGNLVTSAFLTWMPMYLVRDLGWSLVESGGILGPIYLFSGIAMMPLSGMLADKLGAWDKRSRVWFAAPCYLFMVGLYVLGFHSGFFSCIVIAMLLNSLPLTGLHIATQELVPAQCKASSYGVYVTFIQGMGLLGPALGGFFAEAWGVRDALLIMQLFLATESLVLFAAGFFYLRDYARAAARSS